MNERKIRTIKRRLEDKGITLTAIADELGVHKVSVSRVLRRPRESARIRAAIAAHLGYNPWPDLPLSGRDQPPPAA